MSRTTPATLALSRTAVAFSLAEYAYDGTAERVGLHAAAALGVSPAIVLKTLMVEVDGKRVDWSETVTYRGMMMTGVPNFVWVMGYFRASWTLRVDMMGDFVCNLLNHMDDIDAKKVEVVLRPQDEGMAIMPWIEADNFNPGYLMRGLDAMPRRGDKPEWRHNQDYWAEKDAFPLIDLRSDEFRYA